MRILIDTNVILDILQKREPFFADSYRALRKAIESDVECLISATAATDIFYMLRKAFGSAKQAREQLEQLAQIVTFADVQGMDIHTALMRDMPDFEDAVVDAVARILPVRWCRPFFLSIFKASNGIVVLGIEQYSGFYGEIKGIRTSILIPCLIP